MHRWGCFPQTGDRLDWLGPAPKEPPQAARGGGIFVLVRHFFLHSGLAFCPVCFCEPSSAFGVHHRQFALARSIGLGSMDGSGIIGVRTSEPQKWGGGGRKDFRANR